MEIDALLKALEGGGDAATIALVWFLANLLKRVRKLEEKMIYIITAIALKNQPDHVFTERD